MGRPRKKILIRVHWQTVCLSTLRQLTSQFAWVFGCSLQTESCGKALDLNWLVLVIVYDTSWGVVVGIYRIGAGKSEEVERFGGLHNSWSWYESTTGCICNNGHVTSKKRHQARFEPSREEDQQSMEKIQP